MYCTIVPMASRMRETVVRRPNLPLTARDENDLQQLRASVGFRRALQRVAPGQPDAEADLGEAVLLHAVFQAGLAAIRQAAEEDGYRQLAAQRAGEATERRAIARRRSPRWASET